MQDLSSLNNDELFKLCKSSGISAGPITAGTRSVYEKKLMRLSVSNSIPGIEYSAVKPGAEIQSPVVILKANLQAKESPPLVVEPPKVAHSAYTNLVEPAKSTFVKPVTPKPVRQTEPEICAEKPARRSVERDTQPTIIQSTSTSRIYREEIFSGISSDRPSPQRQQKKTESPSKKVIQPEFRLLNRQPEPQQEQQQYENKYSYTRNEPVARPSTSGSYTTGPNIRKRTATVERPTVLADIPNVAMNEAKWTNSGEEVKKSGGFFNLKYILLVVFVTTIVYFLMMHLQSNPENPIEIE